MEWSFDPWRPGKFEPEVECEYLAENATRSLPYIRGALMLLLLILLVTSVIGDKHISQMTRESVLLSRLPILVIILTLLAGSYSKWGSVRPGAILVIVIATTSVTSSYIAILDVENSSFRMAATHLGYGILLVALAPNRRAIVVGSLLLFVIPNVVFVIRSGEGELLFTANLLMFFGASVIIVLGYMIDHGRRRIFSVSAELTRLATTDALTGVFNRRHFIDIAKSEVGRSKRYDRPISCLMLDIDHFKNINDTFGHSAGDEVLKKMAKASVNALRKIDTFGRLGGEEFAVILPETGIAEATLSADRLRRALSELVVMTDDKTIGFTVSIGVAALASTDDTIDTILKRADEALYRAKRSGRNRVLATA